MEIHFFFFCCSSFLWLILFELAWCTDLLFMKVSNHTTESYWSEGRVVVMVKEINHCCLTFYRREQSQTRSNLLNNTGETNSVIARAEANNICLIRHFPVSGETQYKEPCFWSVEEMSMVKNIKVNLTLTGWEEQFHKHKFATVLSSFGADSTIISTITCEYLHRHLPW